MALEAEPPYHFSLLDDGNERGTQRLADVAPTIAALLGTAPPAQAQGRAPHALLDESYG